MLAITILEIQIKLVLAEKIEEVLAIRPEIPCCCVVVPHFGREILVVHAVTCVALMSEQKKFRTQHASHPTCQPSTRQPAADAQRPLFDC
jgi:hypothetical protein